MKAALTQLLDNNRQWAAQLTAQDPEFFRRLSRQQAPDYLWIGCSDSRVPANQIVGLLPGELFVHRNVGNVVHDGDANCLAVLQYAIDVLGVEHVIVTGHYGCGGVQAALEQRRDQGPIDAWLAHIRSVYHKHEARLSERRDDAWRRNRLCELNVIEQVYHVCQTLSVREAWQRSRPLAVHGWIYDIADGLLRDLQMTVTSEAEVIPAYRAALALG